MFIGMFIGTHRFELSAAASLPLVNQITSLFESRRSGDAWTSTKLGDFQTIVTYNLLDPE